jgi:hypothetical protein
MGVLHGWIANDSLNCRSGLVAHAAVMTLLGLLSDFTPAFAKSPISALESHTIGARKRVITSTHRFFGAASFISTRLALIRVVRSWPEWRVFVFDREEDVATKEPRQPEIENSGIGSSQIVESIVPGRKQLLGISDAESHGSRNTIMTCIFCGQIHRTRRTIESGVRARTVANAGDGRA